MTAQPHGTEVYAWRSRCSSSTWSATSACALKSERRADIIGLAATCAQPCRQPCTPLAHPPHAPIAIEPASQPATHPPTGPTCISNTTSASWSLSALSASASDLAAASCCTGANTADGGIHGETSSIMPLPNTLTETPEALQGRTFHLLENASHTTCSSTVRINTDCRRLLTPTIALPLPSPLPCHSGACSPPWTHPAASPAAA